MPKTKHWVVVTLNTALPANEQRACNRMIYPQRFWFLFSLKCFCSSCLKFANKLHSWNNPYKNWCSFVRWLLTKAFITRFPSHGQKTRAKNHVARIHAYAGHACTCIIVDHVKKKNTQPLDSGGWKEFRKRQPLCGISNVREKASLHDADALVERADLKRTFLLISNKTPYFFNISYITNKNK